LCTGTWQFSQWANVSCFMAFSGYNSILDIAIRVVMVLNKILVYGLSLVFLLSLSLCEFQIWQLQLLCSVLFI
jgi:hypothetical protein